MEILLLEDNPGDVRILKEILAEVENERYILTQTARLDEALQRIAEKSFDIMLSDLSLPDSHGLETFQRLHEFAPSLPIIVLSGMSDEAMAVRAVQTGAQDYLVKGQVDSHLLSRAMRYAIERNRMQLSLQSLSLVDELTGLYNRRGFLTLAEQQVKFARRANNALLLLFADLDCMKAINDTHGHAEGDNALMHTAHILRQTLRESDLVARIGGDEFVVLALETCSDSADALPRRVDESVKVFNAQGIARYQISISIGTARFDPEHPCSLDELLTTADKLMYEAKRRKKCGIV